jgi:hypothetical protein
MLYLNNKVYSCYWDISLLCLSRASVEQHQHIRPARAHWYFIGCPSEFPTGPFRRFLSLISWLHDSRAPALSASIWRSRSLCSCPPRVASPHPSQRPSGVARPHVSRQPPDSLLTFLIADHTLLPFPHPVRTLSARADPGCSWWGWAGGPAPNPGSLCANFPFAMMA